jgi:hypothetical protein
MESKTAQATVAHSTYSGRHMIDPRRNNAPVTQGMREAAQAIARAVVKESSNARKLNPT